MEKDKESYVIPNFHHRKGVHCTSSALRNVFEFHTVKLSEAMVFGLGLGMGLSYLKIPGMEPFFGGRNKDFVKDFCDTLKVGLNEFKTKDPEKGWLRLERRIKSNIPSVINIDMAFLPYQDLPDDFHFGGHTIVACGYNPATSTVLVTDTHFSDILEVPVEDLTKGRNSKKDKLMTPKNVIFEFSFTEDIPLLESVIERVLNNTGSNLLSKSGRVLKLMGIHAGTNGIEVFINNLDKWLKLTENTFELRFMQQAGYIGTKEFNYGTGGGLFRYLFSEFLEESAIQTKNESLHGLSDFYSQLGEKWETVASLFEVVSRMTNPEKRKSMVSEIKTNLLEIKTLEEKGAHMLIDFKLK